MSRRLKQSYLPQKPLLHKIEDIRKLEIGLHKILCFSQIFMDHEMR